MRRVHHDDEARQQLLLDLYEIARQGARKMLAEAVEAEIEFCIEAARGERDENGHALVTRDGYARERQVLVATGAVEVRAPRVYDLMVDENGERQRFKSVILSTCAARPKSRRSCRSYISMASPAETSSRLLYKKSYPKAVSVFEAGIADTLTYLSYPGSYRARIRSTNMLERLFKEIKRGTRVVGVLPNETSASTLATEIAQRSSEEWALMRNLTMDALETLRKPDSQLSRH